MPVASITFTPFQQTERNKFKATDMTLSTKRYKARQVRAIAALLFVGFAATAAAQVRHGVSAYPSNPSTPAAVSAVTVHPLPLAQSSLQGSTNPAQGITYTCDANFSTYGPVGLCAALNSILPLIYSSTFTNASASIYILFDPTAGLGESVQYPNFVTYSAYQAKLLSESTDPAAAFVPAAEPAIFGTLPVNITSALARHLGISGATSITAEGDSCSTPGVGDCYDAIIHIVTPEALAAATGGQGLSYRSLSGSTNGTTDNYDFFSVVEHETDEVLGTASCVSYTGPGTTATPNCVSAEDLFRYTSPGVRIFNTFAYSYFSADGGVTDLDSNTYNTTQGGGDWGDFSQICVFVQDAEACPSSILAANSFDITNDGPGGTPGPEVAMLDAVGYNLNKAPVISAVTITAITSTSVTITWTTDQASTSLVNYGTTTSYGSQSPANTTLVTAHSVTLTGLTPGTTYDYDVVSANSSSLSATSGNFTFTTTAGAPVITVVTASGITTTSATITWTTNQASTSEVCYGTTTPPTCASPATNNALVTSHSVQLTGLTPGTIYYYEVVSTNSSNLSSTSNIFSFTTMAVAPAISAVTATAITSTSATIVWLTNQASSSLVNYGTTTAYGSHSALNSTLMTAHSVTLTGLTPGTTYDYDVVSANSSNLSATSGNFSFTTTSGSGPVLTNIASYPVANTTGTILWTSSQNATSQVNYGTTAAYGSQTPLNTTLTLYHVVPLSGLNPGTTYHYSVVSTNASGQTTSSPDFSFTTTGVATTPAPVITAVASSGITSTSATITWTTDESSSSQVLYGTTTAYGSQSPANNTLVTSHSVTLTGLTPGTTYDYAAVSTNSTGGSTTSANFTFSTAGSAPPPPVISAVTAGAITSSSVTITWTTDQASSSQVKYGTTASYGSQSPLNSALVTAHSVTLTGLTPGTLYDFDVVSANSSNASATSGNFTFTTTASTTPGPVISRVASYPVANTTATILWTTDQSSSSQVFYGTTTAYGSQTTLDPTLNIYHVVPLAGLTPGTTYHYSVVSTNSSGVSSTSPDSSFTTTGTAPNPSPVITLVTASGLTANLATITWTTDQASTSQVSYGTTTAYGSQSLLNNTLVTTHSVTLTSLTAGTTYDYAVTSNNSTGGSTMSGNFTFTTTGTPPPPPVISAVTASAITSSSVTITWTTDRASSSQVSYGTTTAYGSHSPLNSTLVTVHSVTLTGLAAGTIYDYAVTSASSPTSSSTSANFTFTTTASTTPAPMIFDLAYYGITGTGITIGWSTDQLSTTAVQYGTTPAFGQTSPLQPALTISHGVTLTGLAGGTTYYFQAVSTNSSGTAGYSATFSFTTLPTAGPVLTNIVVMPATGNSATVAWTVSEAATTQVEFGANASYGKWSPATTGNSTPLGYVPSGTVHYRLHSMDSFGNQTVTPDMTFIEP